MTAQPTPPEPDDASLMALVAQGRRDAFAALVERHKDAVVSYLARLLGDRELAQELGQETFLRLFRAAGAYAEQGNLVAFLFRIATNLARSEERRRRRVRLWAPFLPHQDTAEPTAAEALLRRELDREVARALAALPLRLRVPLVLHELEGWAHVDIARSLGCRVGTVKSRIHRGRQKLKQRLEPYWNGGEAWKTPA